MTNIYGKGAKGLATKLHSLIVRSRGACQKCGESTYSKLQCAHIITRTFSAIRTDERNAWCLCARCHFRVDTHADEKMALVDETIGREEFDRLKAKTHPPTKMDWEAEVERLTAVWAEIREAA